MGDGGLDHGRGVGRGVGPPRDHHSVVNAADSTSSARPAELPPASVSRAPASASARAATLPNEPVAAVINIDLSCTLNRSATVTLAPRKSHDTGLSTRDMRDDREIAVRMSR